MNNKNSRLEEFINSPKKSLWKLSIPMMLGMSVQAIYMLIDTAFIGNWVGWEALTGIGVVFPLLFIIMGITFGLGTGATTLIAQSIGAENKKKADSLAEHTIILGIILSILFLLFGYYYGDSILVIQGANNLSLSYANDYFYTMLIGTPFMILGIFFRSILSGEGDTLLPMKILGFGTILNILLDPIFIYFYSVKGAALATVISQLLVFIIFMYFIIIKDHAYISFNLKKFTINKKYLLEIFKIGIPAALSMVIMSGGIFFYNTILSQTSTPNTAIAAYATAHRIEHLFFIPLISIATSMVTLIGMFYGAKKHELIRIVVLYCIKCSLFISILFGLIFYFFGENIFPIFINNNKNILLANNVINIGISYFRFFAFAVPFITIGMICSRVIQGLGKSYPMFIITCLRVIVISCSLAYYFIVIKEKPVEYAWISILISCILSSIISTIWMLIEIRKAQLNI
ncbi:MAG: hypothetical protein CMG64_02400 [Candidatus Marinimicrobia bacterium]|nr:hypothetical protein [Candidatus Neomarinimicrobiota bacterium]|tara:strand:- start:7423 stop:8799 length:1377 start_codon:yes stop_codon:yes gene_type:complete